MVACKFFALLALVVCLAGVNSALVDGSIVKILMHGGDCDFDGEHNHYGMSGWELDGVNALSTDSRDSGSNFAQFHTAGGDDAEDCRNGDWFRLSEVPGHHGVFKILAHGGECDKYGDGNHYRMYGWELDAVNALSSDRRDSSSVFAQFHSPGGRDSASCRNGNWFRFVGSFGVYKIIQHGGDCDLYGGANHYGIYGWELAGQGALSQDRRDSGSNWAQFHSPAQCGDCRNNNHFLIKPVHGMYVDAEGNATIPVMNAYVRQKSDTGLLVAGLVGVAAGGVIAALGGRITRKVRTPQEERLLA